MTKNNNGKDWRPILIYLGVNIVIGILIGIVLGATSQLGKLKITEAMMGAISTVFVDATVAVVFIVIYHERLKKDLKRLTKKNIIYIIVSAIILIIANKLISELFIKLNVEMSNQESIIEYFSVLKIPVIFAIVIFAPFVEEMMFRYSIRTICKNNIVFVLISGIAFGLVHGIGIVTILYVLIGMALAFTYLKNDENIIVPTGVHLLNNLFAAIELLLIL